MDIYYRVVRDVPQPVGRDSAVAYLNKVLPRSGHRSTPKQAANS